MWPLKKLLFLQLQLTLIQHAIKSHVKEKEKRTKERYREKVNRMSNAKYKIQNK